ncbi:hypothetical protein Syun_031944 [Stephania yunnanensis]|uniref:Uncharacterized protein n=1 Tax=Stephania yunnanensis TaxID=152371 RepID=A0AAP0HBS2_9MAGN
MPRGKDEKDFEKRVKECLKLSGGKRMGAAMRLGRMRNGDGGRRSTRGVDRRGLRRRPKPGCCYAVETSFFAIVVRSARHSACLRYCVLSVSAVGSPFGRLETRTKESTCVRVNGRVNRKAQGRRLAGSLSGLLP